MIEPIIDGVYGELNGGYQLSRFVRVGNASLTLLSIKNIFG